MQMEDMLAAVRSDRVQFATMRPPDTTFSTLDRRVVLVAPPELTELATLGKVEVLDALIALLREPDRAWAAEVVLAALTRREEKLVDSFAGQPELWWDAVGNRAYERWRAWMDQSRARLKWDPAEGAFVERC